MLQARLGKNSRNKIHQTCGPLLGDPCNFTIHVTYPLLQIGSIWQRWWPEPSYSAFTSDSGRSPKIAYGLSSFCCEAVLQNNASVSRAYLYGLGRHRPPRCTQVFGHSWTNSSPKWDNVASSWAYWEIEIHTSQIWHFHFWVLFKSEHSTFRSDSNQNDITYLI